MLNFLIFGLVVYVGLLLGLYVLQRHLIYHPERAMGAPSNYDFATAETFTVQTEDNIPIAVWHHAAREGYPTLVYFHGNAGHLGMRAFKLKAFADIGLGVIAVSYRGYGDSGGKPTEEGLYHDARAAIRFAHDTLKIPFGHLILYGESLGSGVAVHAATEFAVGALVLEAPYTSVADRSAELYPFVPARLMVKDKFESLRKISKVRCPLLILHGEKDVVIPVRHGRVLLEQANEPKKGVFYPAIGHADFDALELAQQVLAFAQAHELVK